MFSIKNLTRSYLCNTSATSSVRKMEPLATNWRTANWEMGGFDTAQSSQTITIKCETVSGVFYFKRICCRLCTLEPIPPIRLGLDV
jgi:hypothetical protein